jgi:hypothetical protein
MNSPDFDLAAAHRHFAAQCFNLAWELIDKPQRTPDEDEQMIRLNQASLWHWSQRADCQPKNLSIGYWQAARIHSILGRAEDAVRYAELCLENSPEEDPFLMGYAYEALARSTLLIDDRNSSAQHLAMARKHAALVTDADDRQLLERDLQSLAELR